MKQNLKKINWLNVTQILVLAALMIVPFIVPTVSHAQLQAPDCSGTGLNCSQTNANQFIKTIINWLLTIAFGVAVLFLIIGGFWYITSAGNEETAEKGKNTAINAIIGVVIIVLSYVIVNVVYSLIKGSAGGGGNTP